MISRSVSVAALAVAFAQWGAAQSERSASTGGKTFEVASVKPNKSGQYTASGSEDAGRFVYGNRSLMSYILQAYQLLGYQVSGPGWLDSERYDISAIKPPGASEEQVRMMFQNLLVERFKLALHHEHKEMSVYALVVGKRGQKFKPSDPASASNIGSGPHSVHGTASSMTGLAYLLMRWTDRLVVDETGLTGLYDFKLAWKPEGTQDSASSTSALLSAIDDQLGLNLQPKKLR